MPLSIDLCGYDKQEFSGGPMVWLTRLPGVLREHGIEVRIRLLSWHDPQDGALLAFLKGHDFDVVGKRFEDTERNVRWLIEQTSMSPPDVFVANHVAPAFFAARSIRQSGIPTIGILHSDDDFYRAIQDEFVFGQPANAVSSIVCVSRELQQQVADRQPSRTRVTRIPYGVPTPELKAQRIEGKLRLAFVGRFAEQQKRISDVADAFCRVLREVPGTEAVMYGDGPDKQNVEQIIAAEAAGLPITLGGNVPSDQVQQRLVDNSDVIVLLSDYEGLPISLLEAMACGVVPVCLDIRSGIPELIQDGVTGLTVNNRGDDFVAAIRRLKEDESLWHRLSAAARERVRRENSLESSAQAWADLARALNDASTTRRPIELPTELDLPPVNPALARQDRRTPTTPELARTPARSWAQSIKSLFGGGTSK